MGYFKDALRTLSHCFNFNKTIDDKKQTLGALKKLLDNYSTYSAGNLIELVNFIRANIKTVSNLRAGVAQTFYSATPYSHISTSVKNIYETGNCKTVHKSKGDEFECVLLLLEAKGANAFNENTALSFLTAPNLVSN